jgi:YggT family protein
MRTGPRSSANLLLLPLLINAAGSFVLLENLGSLHGRSIDGKSHRSFDKGVQRHLLPDASLASDVILTGASYAFSNSFLIAETEPWVQPLANVLDPFLNLMSFAMLTRVVLSWYPTLNVKELPWILVVLPTEPLLRAARGVVPPAFGVDITPIVWLGVFTFIHEILLGQQGLLILKLQYGI